MSENQKSKYPAQADEPTFSQFEGAELVAQVRLSLYLIYAPHRCLSLSICVLLTPFPVALFSSLSHLSLSFLVTISSQEFKCSRPEMEQFALESHLNAAQAIKEGRFKNEIVTIQVGYIKWIIIVILLLLLLVIIIIE